MRKENIMELQYIVLGLLAVTGSSTSSFNCSTTKQSNPFVQVYDAADNVQNFSHNGTVLLQNPSSDEAIGWIGLECSHTKPIRWVYDFNFIEEGIGDSYSLTERKVNRNDFYNTSSYIFKAEVELKVYRPGRNFVLFCVTFENICERTVAHVYYDETRKQYVLKSLTKAEENNTLVRELEQAAVKRQNWLEKVNHNETCAVNFSVVDRDNNYIFSFFPNRTSYSSRPIPDRQNLENTYLFYEKLSPACFIPICENCTIYYGRNNSSHWPILFFDYKKNESLVVHAYFTLITRRTNGSTSPGKLKLDWEKFDAQDMVLMELGTDRNPSSNKFYSGETLLINCYGSSYLFSFGTQIAYISSASNTDGKITFLDVKERNLLKGLGRLGAGQIPLEWPNDGERYNITVYCFSPVWNSPTEWVNISETVEVYAPSLQVNGTNQLILLPTDLGVHNINFSCKATGNPAPEVQVIPPGNNSRIGIHKTVDGNTMIVDVSIVKVDETHVGVYNCVATNPSGDKFYEFELRSSISKSRKGNNETLNILTIIVIK
ncbi:unnamed protein product [Orchesella dallaii]|uniref:Immunoglobulin I-set domain-containing protein n=1 Tax=Orchesella dallaii TaxID=48710 RepID=A0ABP1PRX3_9HEXA